jgi:hypothetical protein
MEILKRKIITKHEIICDERVQFSINNYGHLTIRYFNTNAEVDTKNQQTKEEDTLIVLEAESTRKLIDFLRRFPFCDP